MRREHADNLDEHEDQGETVDADSHPPDSTGIVENRTESNQTEGEDIAERPSLSDLEDPNSKQVIVDMPSNWKLKLNIWWYVCLWNTCYLTQNT